MTSERLDIRGNRIGRRAQNGKSNIVHANPPSYTRGNKRCSEHGWQNTTGYRCTFRGCNRKLKSKSQSKNSRLPRLKKAIRY